jgi:hypothetical protein
VAGRFSTSAHLSISTHKDDPLLVPAVCPDTPLTSKPRLLHCLAHLHRIFGISLRECLWRVFVSESCTVLISALLHRKLTDLAYCSASSRTSLVCETASLVVSSSPWIPAHVFRCGVPQAIPATSPLHPKTTPAWNMPRAERESLTLWSPPCRC